MPLFCNAHDGLGTEGSLGGMLGNVHVIHALVRCPEICRSLSPSSMEVISFVRISLVSSAVSFIC